jgi:hypothetical protein
VALKQWPLPNVGLGVSAEDQAAADERIPLLLDTPAAMRFVSAEPLLGPVNLGAIKAPHYPDETEEELAEDWRFNALTGGDYYFIPGDKDMPGLTGDGPWRESALDWVIAGGESGRGAWPMHPDWARGLRDQCAEAGVAFFFKQWGEWLPWEPEHGPCWKSQGGRSEDHHALFPVDWDNQTKWDDGLWAVNDGESQAAFERVGKSASGSLLDGVSHKAFPAVLAAAPRAQGEGG